MKLNKHGYALELIFVMICMVVISGLVVSQFILSDELAESLIRKENLHRFRMELFMFRKEIDAVHANIAHNANQIQTLNGKMRYLYVP